VLHAAAVLIAHLSDLHLDGTARALERARRVVAHVRSLEPGPDLVLVSGDIADQGEPEQYTQAQELLAGLDALVLPGNHDRRRPMRAWLGLHDSDEPISDVRHYGDVTVIGADSTVPGQDHGRLAEPCRALIETEAARPGPLLVALHHPPVAIGSGLLDPIRLTEPDELMAPLAARRASSIVLCGHAHTALATEHHGVAVRIAPAVASTLRLPQEPEPDSLDRSAAPAFALHQLTDDGALVTHYRTVR
jgi:3',5'-cyclic AMP phosphodiesterase CpdA